MKKIVLIGQAPGRGGGDEPLAGRVGKRLAGLMGISHAKYLEKFERTNVLDFFPGKQGKGDAFPVRLARAKAMRMRRDLRGCTVVMLGKSVGKVFGLNAEYFRWVDIDGVRAVVVPHPSGVNRWWNEQANMDAAEKFFDEIGRMA